MKKDVCPMNKALAFFFAFASFILLLVGLCFLIVYGYKESAFQSNVVSSINDSLTVSQANALNYSSRVETDNVLNVPCIVIGVILLVLGLGFGFLSFKTMAKEVDKKEEENE